MQNWKIRSFFFIAPLQFSL